MRPILYIHGFASSAHSSKAHLLRRHFPDLVAPSLPYVPQLAIETLSEWVRTLGAPLLVGSSLGGCYALHLAARFDLPAVLINPALKPAPLLRPHLGLIPHFFDGSKFELTASHLDFLDGLWPERTPSEGVQLLVQLGDELIDQRESLRLLPAVRAVVEPGGNHGFEGLERHVTLIRSLAAGTWPSPA